MRALIFSKVTEGHGPGGMQRHLSLLISWLASAGWEVTVITTERGEFDPGHPMGLETMPRTRPGAYSRAWWAATRRLIRSAPLDRWNAIISENGAAWSVIHELRHEAKRPPVVMFRHGTSLLNLAQSLPPRTLRSLWSAAVSMRDYLRFARPLSRYVDMMVAVSARIAESIRRESHALREVRVVPLGVDLMSYAPTSDPAAARAQLGLDTLMSTLVWVGRDVPGKRVDMAMAVFEALREAGADYQLVLVADRARPQTRTAVDRLRERWGPSILLLENAGIKELQRVYAASDLALFPSTLPEGVPLVILEALASGIPVLCAATPALRQVPPLKEQREWFAPDASIGAWAERVIDLTVEPRLSRAKQTARGLAEQYCDQRLTEEASIRAIHDALQMRRRTEG